MLVRSTFCWCFRQNMEEVITPLSQSAFFFTGTDTYSSIAAGIGSLKGPLHGGANIQVTDMFHHLQGEYSGLDKGG